MGHRVIPQPENRLPLTSVILAGGRSTRMGEDKRRMPIAGRSMLQRAIDVAEQTCTQTLIVVRDPADAQATATDTGIRTVCDCVPGAGPLAGIVSGLIHSPTQWILVQAADMPFVTPAIPGLLWSAVSPDCEAVAPRGPAGPEPLLALYNVACVREALTILGRPDASPRQLLARIKTQWVSSDSIRATDPSKDCLLNVNTQSEYRIARSHAVEPAGYAPR